MARTIITEALSGSLKTVTNRTFHTEITTRMGKPYQVAFQRQQVIMLDDNITEKTRLLPEVRFNVADEASREVTVNGLTLTYAQLAAFVAQVADDMESVEGRSNAEIPPYTPTAEELKIMKTENMQLVKNLGDPPGT